MFRLTLKNLMAEKLPLLLTTLAVSCAFFLVLFFGAVFAGESEKIVAYLRHADPDVWVMQKGVSNMHMATSFLWDWKVDRIESIEGVKRATPILYLNSVLEAGDENWFSYVVGLTDGQERAGPWKMVSGRAVPGPGEAVIPDVLAQRAGLSLGDEVILAQRHFKIVGLSDETFSMANSIAFVTATDLEEILSLTGSTSYVLVDAEAGVDAAVLAARIEDTVDKVSAVENEVFIENDHALATQMGVELIWIMTMISAALAALLVAFTVYNFTARKRADLAVSKALGFPNGAVYASVAFQAVSITVIGLLIAVVLLLVSSPLAARFAPHISLHLTGVALSRAILLAGVVALLAALVPARQVTRIDPITAFRL